MSDVGSAAAARLRALDQSDAHGGWDQGAGRRAFTAMRDDGWLTVGVPEQLGGGDGTLADAVEVAAAVTARGWPSPAADQLLITGQVLAAARVRVPEGLTLVVPRPGNLDGSGRLHADVTNLAWAPEADRFAVFHEAPGGSALSFVSAADAHLTTCGGLTETPRADVRIDGVIPETTVPTDLPPETAAAHVVRAGRMARCAQSAAALERVLDLTVAHVRVREQFGRPLAAFQAVQHLLAHMAAEVAAARAVVDRAVDAQGTHSSVAVATVRVAAAGSVVTRAAHQLHGALGITREHALHRHTLSLLEWQDDFDTPDAAARDLGTAALEATELWPWLTQEQR